MADEPEQSDTETKANQSSREHHTPQHASVKHDREPSKGEFVNPGEAAEMSAEAANVDASDSKTKSQGPQHRLRAWVAIHKKISIPLAVVLVLVLLAAVPATRYMLAGTVLRKDFSVLVTDAQTNKPVSSASVILEGTRATTNNNGVAKIRANVGNAKLAVTKKYYQGTARDVLVPIGKQKQAVLVKLVATGRQVPVKVINRISGKPIANATITAQGTEAKTDAEGEVAIVLPAGKSTVPAQVNSKGYNTAEVTVKVTAAVDPANTFQITPAGKVYFLSNFSGSLDVVKTNLDGTGRQTVLAGTGKEDKPSTVLLAARDWKHLALFSKRDGGDNAKLFLIDTSSDQVTTMDEGDATFTPLGWSGDRFIYTVYRSKLDSWQPKRDALKSYDALSKKITVLDETNAEGDQSSFAYENISGTYIFDQKIVYLKSWNSGGTAYYTTSLSRLNGKQTTVSTIQSDGSQKKVVKAYDLVGDKYVSVESRPADFNELYIRSQYGNDTPQHDEYKDGKVTAASDITDEKYYNGTYLTYIVSPSGNKTFWTDYRDGKNVFFVGDGSGANGKQLAGSSDDYAAYGWYTDDYVLVTKKGSEMRIMPVSGLAGGVDAAQKISDYYKPNYNLRGYGYGYGG